MNSLLVILGTSAAAALFIVLALGVKLRPEKKVIRSPISKGRHSKRASLRDKMPRRKPPVRDAVPPVDMHWAVGEEVPPETSSATVSEAVKGSESPAPSAPAGETLAEPAASSESAGEVEAVQSPKVAAHDRAPMGASATAQLPLTDEPAEVSVEPKAKTRTWPSALRPFSSPPPPPIPPPLAPVEAADDVAGQTAKEGQEAVPTSVADPAAEPDTNGPVSPTTNIVGPAEPGLDAGEAGSVVAPAPETSVLETAKSETEQPQKPDVASTATSEATPAPTPPPAAGPGRAGPAAKPSAPTPSYYDLDMKPPGTEEKSEGPATGWTEAPTASPVQAQLEDVIAEKPETIPEPAKETSTDPAAARADEAEKQRAAISPTKAYEAAVTITPPPPAEPSKPDLLRRDFLDVAKRPSWGGWKRTASRGMAVATTKLLLALMLFSVVLSLIAVFAIKWLGAVMRGLVGT